MAIERIAFYQYEKTGTITERWLDAHDFHYDKIFSDKDCEAYSTRFPVYYYEGITVLDGVITIWPSEDNLIRVNVYEHNTRNHYARFYYWEYGTDDKYMSVINNKIMNKLKELDIKVIPPEVKDDKQNTESV